MQRNNAELKSLKAGALGSQPLFWLFPGAPGSFSMKQGGAGNRYLSAPLIQKMSISFLPSQQVIH